MRREDKTRAWVSVMYGCNNFCSYCIVPYVRGRERSRKSDDILAECRQLIEAGVRIYEYTGGFMHAKLFVSDDAIATVGTANLDFRSLYLHFECGTCLYRTASIAAIKEDYLQTLRHCKEITEQSCRAGIWKRLLQSICRLLAPLM